MPGIHGGGSPPRGSDFLKLTARQCPICGPAGDARLFLTADVNVGGLNQYGFASRKAPEYMHWQLRECRNCDVLYADPAPDPDALLDAYRTAAFDSGREARYASRTYARLLHCVLARLPDRTGALDVGAGDGAFLEELLTLGFTGVAGIEPSEAPVEVAKPVVRPLIRLQGFRAGLFEAEQFRMVTCFQTIEHASDPLELCREAVRILKPGGALVLVAHNRRSLSARIMGRKSPIFDIEHLQLFSRPSLKRLLAAAGLCDVSVGMIVNRYPLSYWMRLFPLPILKRSAQWFLNRSRLGLIPLPLPAGNLMAFGFKPPADARCSADRDSLVAAREGERK